jgi:hypothetical protein
MLPDIAPVMVGAIRAKGMKKVGKVRFAAETSRYCYSIKSNEIKSNELRSKSLKNSVIFR